MEMHADLVHTDWAAHVEDQVAQVVLVVDHLVIKGVVSTNYGEVLDAAVAAVAALPADAALMKLSELVAGSHLHVTEPHGYSDCPFAETTRLTLEHRKVEPGQPVLRRRTVSA